MSLDETLDWIEEKWPVIAAGLGIAIICLAIFIAWVIPGGIARDSSLPLLFGLSLILKYQGDTHRSGGLMWTLSWQ